MMMTGWLAAAGWLVEFRKEFQERNYGLKRNKFSFISQRYNWKMKRLFSHQHVRKLLGISSLLVRCLLQLEKK